MTALGNALKGMQQARKQVAANKGWRQLQAFARLDKATVEGAMVASAQALKPIAAAFLVANLYAAGIKSKTLAAGMSNISLEVTPTLIKIYMPSGLKFSNGRGDVYAAAGAYRYGGVWQPLFKKKGSFYKDLSTGRMVPRSKASGALGDRLKRNIKQSVLKTGKIDSLGKRGRDAFERAQDQAAKHTGKAIDLHRGITVRGPKFPFMRFTESQQSELNRAWAEGVANRLRSKGFEVKLG